MNKKEDNLELKKFTLQAWAKLALKEGFIDNNIYIKMSHEIDKIKN